MTSDRGDAPRVVIAVVIAWLAVVNVARSTIVPGQAHFVLNVANAVVVVALGVGGARRLARTELGLGRADVAAGFRYGLGVVAIVAAISIVAVALPFGRDGLDVAEARTSGATLAWRVGVIIPIGTVLVEEVIFRGVLHGLAGRILTPVRAMALGAVLFGLWHVYPAWRAQGVAVALGTFVVTSAAGVGFIWLRSRSESLVAPVLAHLATNTVPLSVAWWTLR